MSIGAFVSFVAKNINLNTFEWMDTIQSYTFIYRNLCFYLTSESIQCFQWSSLECEQMNRNFYRHIAKFDWEKIDKIWFCSDWDGKVVQVYYGKTRTIHWYIFPYHNRNGYTKHLKVFFYPFHYDSKDRFFFNEDLDK